MYEFFEVVESNECAVAHSLALLNSDNDKAIDDAFIGNKYQAFDFSIFNFLRKGVK